MNIKYNKALWLIIILAIVMMIPFLGLTDFNTKGEPREAVVAYTMLEHGNWILPINNGGDIPYKPPFFHWCIAFFSLFIGHVNEYTSRLPSAVSLVLMTIGGFVFYAKRKNAPTSLIAAILTLTAFEVHRAGMNCRVDMVNTAFMVGAMYLLYRWWEKGKHQLPWLAILCMSGATLTKGPVGIILPCFVMGVFMLTQRENFWGIVWRMALTAMLHALENNDLLIPCSIFMVITLEGVYLIFRALKKKNPDNIVSYTLATIVGLFLMLDSSLQPPVLNTKTDKHLAPVIEKKFDTSKLYSYMSVDMLHFFSLNFYLGDKIQQFDKVLPQDGVLMIPEEDMPDFLEKFGKDYTFQKVWEVRKTVEWHNKVGFYRFVKTSANIALNK